MSDPNPTELDRMGVLHEQNRLGLLDESGQRELAALLERRPDLRELIEQLEEEEQSMQSAIQGAIDHFDFGKASGAVKEKLRHDRQMLRVLGSISIFGIVFATISAWAGLLSWGSVPFMAVAWSFPILLHWWVLCRRRRLALQIAEGSTNVAQVAFEQHRAIGRNERVVMQAVGIICTIGLLLAIVDSLMDSKYWNAAIFAVAIALVVPAIWKQYGTARSVQRHERMLSGDLSTTGWLSGKDADA